MLHKYSELPDEDTKQSAIVASRQLAQLKSQLSGEFNIHLGSESVTLPKVTYDFLVHMLVELSKGNAVTLVPLHAELSTQEAANHLNVSRPFLIGLLNEGKIPFRKVGSHRRIKADDLYKYKKQQDEESAEALQELADQSQKFDMGY